MFKEIRPDNVVMYAMKHYNNPQGDSEKEFLDDMKRFKYIKRLLRKYQDSKELRERLILNHIIVLNNVFGPEASSTLLLFKIERELWVYWNHHSSYLLVHPQVRHLIIA
jgi:hypothetical protein